MGPSLRTKEKGVHEIASNFECRQYCSPSTFWTRSAVLFAGCLPQNVKCFGCMGWWRTLSAARTNTHSLSTLFSLYGAPSTSETVCALTPRNHHDSTSFLPSAGFTDGAFWR